MRRTLFILLSLELAACAPRTDSGQTTFKTPEAAADALVAALRRDDAHALTRILGDDVRKLIESGDAAANHAERTRFLSSYDNQHRLIPRDADTMTLEVGPDAWPLPIEIVAHDGRWSFDSANVAQELVNRRIGRNELAAIAVCRAFVAAQGARRTANAPAVDSHGYLYRSLAAQDATATAGNGAMMIAYPDEYGTRGVMTFIVNQDGTVYQKDLGKDTQRLAQDATVPAPDATWQPVRDR